MRAFYMYANLAASLAGVALTTQAATRGDWGDARVFLVLTIATGVLAWLLYRKVQSRG
jgi:hypothetical protein